MIEATILNNVLLGVVQGLTEFLPISSSGHLILAREFLGSAGVLDLTFDAFLHFATATAIVVYFWRDILRLSLAFYQTVTGLLPFGSSPVTVLGVEIKEEDTQMVYALIVGTIPAVILGLLLEDIMATLFRNPLLVAGALVVGSGVMIVAERYVKFHQDEPKKGWEVGGWKKGLAIGLFQSLALIPGMSRSGMTISGGMFFGLSRAASARFSFLLGIPIFLGAGVKQALDVGLSEIGVDILAGTVTAFIVAILVIHYLLKFLRNNTLYIFVWYRLLLALTIVVVVTVF